MEESGASGSENWSWRWVVDPLDGTTNFLHGIPHWAISIALEKRLPDAGTETVAGVVYAPAVDEMFWAEKGMGAYMNERRPARLRPARPERGSIRNRHPVCRGRCAPPAGVRAHAGLADATGRRHPPLWRGGA